ncbi:MAG TPA: hypothetical protein V6D22_08710 [Candidatus Obscuribacterales bacterium]
MIGLKSCRGRAADKTLAADQVTLAADQVTLAADQKVSSGETHDFSCFLVLQRYSMNPTIGKPFRLTKLSDRHGELSITVCRV